MEIGSPSGVNIGGIGKNITSVTTMTTKTNAIIFHLSCDYLPPGLGFGGFLIGSPSGVKIGGIGNPSLLFTEIICDRYCCVAEELKYKQVNGEATEHIGTITHIAAIC